MKKKGGDLASLEWLFVGCVLSFLHVMYNFDRLLVYLGYLEYAVFVLVSNIINRYM
jgi:hypothetical protein